MSSTSLDNFSYGYLKHIESKSIGVLTSGGDSQGMNAAIRATVRMGMFLKCKVSRVEGRESRTKFYRNFSHSGLLDSRGLPRDDRRR